MEQRRCTLQSKGSDGDSYTAKKVADGHATYVS